MVGRFCQHWPNVGQTWLLVAKSVDFANVRPMLAQRRLANQNSGCRAWANVGPMVDFYSRWQRAIIGDFGTLRKKRFIMVCLKIIFQ